MILKEDKDPRRMTFYLNYFHKTLIEVLGSSLSSANKQGTKISSFKSSNFIQLAYNCLNQFEWRIPRFWSELIQPLFESMTNQNKAIRELIPELCFRAVSYDLEHSNSNEENLKRFIDLVESKLIESIELYECLNKTDPDCATKKMQHSKIEQLLASATFFQTLLNWIILYTMRSLQPLNSQILRIIPLVSSFFII